MYLKRKTSEQVFRLEPENAFQTEDIRASVPSGSGKRETDGMIKFKSLQKRTVASATVPLQSIC